MSQSGHDSDSTIGATGASSPAQREPEIGDSIGRYVIRSRVGSGAMGVVFAASDPELGRTIALKLVYVDEDEPAARRRLLREAQALARLAHANVVTVHDAGVHGEGVFIAMELIRGETLRDWLDSRPRTWEQIVQVFCDAGRGLAAAHAAELVHRDFKPTNVMIGEDGRTRVMDFGLARTAHSTAKVDRGALSGSGLLASTEQSTTLGTPGYMAPERLLGDPAEPASDQFSFCVALFEALYGRRPFAGRTPAALLANIEGTKVAPSTESQVPKRILAAIMRGLATDPPDRWPDMHVLLAELSHDPSARRRRWAYVAAGVTMIAVGATAAYYRPGRDACSADAKLVGVWDGDSRSRIAAAIRSTDLAYADATVAGVEDRIDEHVEAWRALFRETCESVRVEASSSAQADLRMSCLMGQLQELTAVANVLSTADVTVVENAIATAESLRDPEACTIVGVETVEPPSGVATRERVESARACVAWARALHRAGKREDALAVISECEAQLAEIDYEPVALELLSIKATVLSLSGVLEPSIEIFEDVYYRAKSIGYREVAAKAAVELVRLMSDRAEAPEEGATWARQAEAEIEASGNILAERGFLLLNVGGLALRLGRYELAVELYDETAAFASREVQDTRMFASALNNRGIALHRLGRPAEAAEGYRRALEMLVEAYGPDHPMVGAALLNVGVASRYAGDLSGSLAVLQRARWILELTPGKQFNLAAVHSNLASTLQALGRFAVARDHYERAYEIVRAVDGTSHPQTARLLTNYAQLLVELEAPELAERHALEALNILSRAMGPAHPETTLALDTLGLVLLARGRWAEAYDRYRESARISTAAGQDHVLQATLLGLGHAARKLGNLEEAVVLYERSVAIAETGVSSNATLGQVERALADSLWTLDRKRHRARALDLARSAVEHLQGSGAFFREELTAAEALVASLE